MPRAQQPCPRCGSPAASAATHGRCRIFQRTGGDLALGASLAQPLFDGGRLRARVGEEQARGEQSLSNYRKVVATAVADLRKAYANLDLTEQAFIAERNRVVSLSRAHDLARRGHGAGALGYLDLLDAERNLYDAQLQVSAYRDQLIGQVSAFRALGGGYSPNRSSS